jgi:hypothetical protein
LYSTSIRNIGDENVGFIVEEVNCVGCFVGREKFMEELEIGFCGCLTV